MRGRSTSIKKSAIRRRAILFTAAVFRIGIGVEAKAAVTATWDGGNGNWTDPTMWSSNPHFPQNQTPAGTEYQVVINTPTASTYTVTNTLTSTKINSLTISTANATLAQQGTLTLTTLNITSGTLVANVSASFIQVGAQSLANSGLIKATNGATLAINGISGGTFNGANGTIEADSGSTVRLSANLSTQAQLGNLINNSGTIELDSFGGVYPTISVPTFSFGTTTTGTWLINEVAFENSTVNLPNAELRGVSLIGCTLASDINVNGGITTSIQLPFIANGHTINVAGISQPAGLSFNDPGGLLNPISIDNLHINLGGFFNGKLGINGGGYPGFDTIAPNGVYTFASTSTLTGSGVVAANMVNEGIISAQPSALFNGLVINSAVVNRGTIQAIQGGIAGIQPLPGGGGGGMNYGILAADAESQILVFGNIAFADGSALDITLGNSGTSGILKVSGNLDLSHNESLNLSFIGNPTPGDYEIATYTGTLTGTFAQVTPGCIVDYSHAGEILVNVPEPTAFSLLAACGAFACARRRRNPRRKLTENG